MDRKKLLFGIKVGTAMLALILLACYIRQESGQREARGTAGSSSAEAGEATITSSEKTGAQGAGQGAEVWNEDGTYDSVFGKCAEEWYELSMPAEWDGEQEIVYEEKNDYYGPDDNIFITSDYVLGGTGRYADLSFEDVKFARAYADQLIVLKRDGSVWCRGSLHSLSDQRTLEYPDWKFICVDAVYATLGHNMYMVITKDGSLYCWGDNSLGQFGDGSLLEEDAGFDPENTFYAEPVKVADHIKMVWQGEPMTQYPQDDTKLRTWFLTQEDRLFVCGAGVGGEEKDFDWFGELGDETEGYSAVWTNRLLEVKRKAFGTDYSVRENAFVTECSFKSYNHYEIRDGILYGSGRNECGQLGLGYVDELSVQYEEVVIAEHVKHIDFNGSSLIYLTEKNELYGVGASQRGQLGQEIVSNNLTNCEENCVTTPRLIMEDVRFAKLGATHLLILKTDGTLWGLGDNLDGELGIRKKRTRNYSDPASWTAEPVKIMEKVRAIAASGGNSAAVTENATLYLWGDNSYGQIGNGKSGAGFPMLGDCVSMVPEAIIKNKITEFHFSPYDGNRVKCLAYSPFEDKTYEW